MWSNFFSISCLLLLLCFLNSAECANILFYFGFSTYSHRITAWPLAVQLAESGHSVTFIQSYKSKVTHPRIHEFSPGPPFLEDSDATGISFVDWRTKYGRFGTVYLASYLPLMGYMKCEQFLGSEAGKEFVEQSHFDVVIIDGLFNECAYGLAAKWNAKTIIFGTTHPFIWHQIPFGTVPETSWISELHASFDLPMNFWQRTVSTFLSLWVHYYKQWFYFPKLQTLLKDKLDLGNMPSLAELERRTDLVLYNSHFSEELPRSLPPLFVAVGGMHCGFNNTHPIPIHIAKFIESSGDDGFVLVTFGGEVRLSDLPIETQNVFYNVFRQAKTKFIWKWNEKTKPKEMPANVLTVDWIPQQELLGSKHCRGFISHGGLLSMQEAIWFGVPMIVFPIFAEQDYNAFRLHRTRRGIKLEISTLTSNQLENALGEILTNQMYKENMLKTSKLFRDRPLSPVDTAVYWTEYILRHEDTSHLKPTIPMEQYWWEHRLLDVWTFFLALGISSLWMAKFIISKILGCFGKVLFQEAKKNKNQEKAKSKSKAKKH